MNAYLMALGIWCWIAWIITILAVLKGGSILGGNYAEDKKHWPLLAYHWVVNGIVVLSAPVTLPILAIFRLSCYLS